MDANLHKLVMIAGAGWLILKKLAPLNIYSQDTSHNRNILSSCPSLRKKFFIPTPYLWFEFLQMIYGTKINSCAQTSYQREIIRLSDNGTISLDWQIPDSQKTSKPIIVVAHGLTGGSDSNYITNLVKYGEKLGYLVVVVNNRGNSQTKLTTSELGIVEYNKELHQAIDWIQEKYKKSSLFGIGFSAGANSMMNYAFNTKDACKLKAIVSISNPFDLQESQNKIDQKKP